MRKIKILTIGTVIFVLTGITSVNSVNADNKSSGKVSKPSKIHEPVSYLLLLAGGVTIAAIRRWKSKKGLKGLEKREKQVINENIYYVRK